MDTEGSEALAAFVVLLLVGLGAEQILGFTRMPYTALLLVWGVGIGIANETFQRHWPLLGAGLERWMDISPNLFLALYLPVLLFSAACSLEWHTVKNLIGTGVLLAGPGVLIGAGLTAVVAKFSLPYGWTWVQCFLFGSILGATDPVAAAAVFSEVGLPPRLQTMVNLEALLNDGAAYVLFSIVQAFAQGIKPTSGQIIRQIFRLTVAGPFIGLAFGLVISLCLILTQSTAYQGILLTVTAAYTTYYFSDAVCESSGILSIVTLGLWMCYAGLEQVARPVVQRLLHAWEVLEHVANTLVFLLVGAIIAKEIWEDGNRHSRISTRDFGLAVLLWFYLLIIRILMVTILLPLINFRSTRINRKDLTVLSWSGLRGAVGLALGLMVYENRKVQGHEFRILQFFHIGCIVLLSVTIQGSTMASLLQVLGLIKSKRESKMWKLRINGLLERSALDTIKLAQQDTSIGDADYDVVEKLTQIPSSAMQHSSGSYLSVRISRHLFGSPFRNLCHRFKESEPEGIQTSTLGMEQIWYHTLADKRQMALKAILDTYEHLFQDEVIVPRHYHLLKASVLSSMENPEVPMADWAILRSDFNHTTRSYLFSRAHNCALNTIQILWELEDSIAVSSSSDDSTQSFKDEVARLVRQVQGELHAQNKEARSFIKDMAQAWPETIDRIATTQLALEGLRKEALIVKDMQASGLLEIEEASAMMEQVSFSRQGVRSHTFPANLCPLPELLHANEALQCLPDSYFYREIWPQVRVEGVLEGEAVHRSPKHAACIAVLLRGKVRWRPDDDIVSSSEGFLLGGSKTRSGTILGWSMMGQHPTKAVYIAACPTLLAWLPTTLLQVLSGKSSNVRHVIWRSLGVSIAVQQPNIFSRLSYDEILELVRDNTEPVTFDAGHKIENSQRSLIILSGGLIHHGQEIGAKGRLIRAPGFCRLSSDNFVCWSELKGLLIAETAADKIFCDLNHRDLEESGLSATTNPLYKWDSSNQDYIDSLDASIEANSDLTKLASLKNRVSRALNRGIGSFIGGPSSSDTSPSHLFSQ